MSMPVEISVQHVGNQIELQFASVPGATYQVVSVEVLGETWENSGQPVVADGSVSVIRVDVEGSGNRFFQIIQQ